MRVGVFGATGQVGRVTRALLAERDFPVDEIRYFASAKSAGTTLPWKDKQITVEDTATADFSGLLGSATQQLFDDGTNGDQFPNDGTFSFAITIDGALAAGEYPVNLVSVIDAQGRLRLFVRHGGSLDPLVADLRTLLSGK